LAVPYSAKKTYAFYTCNTTYKKQGAPDRRSLTQRKTYVFYTLSTVYKKQGAPDRHSTHLLLLLARVSPRTKSKGLHSYVLQIYYFINQVSRSFCSSAGVIIPLYHPNNKPSDPDRRFNILIVYNCYQYTRMKSWRRSSMFISGRRFLNSAAAWAITEEIIMLKESSRLDAVF
jgi:hypothetical protein